MNDLISRQVVRLIESDSDAYPEEWNDDYERGFTDALNKVIALPSAQPEYRLNEWCTDCKEYDQEKHCCPRYNRVIRSALHDSPITEEGAKDD